MLDIPCLLLSTLKAPACKATEEDDEATNAAAFRLLGGTAGSAWLLTDKQLDKQATPEHTHARTHSLTHAERVLAGSACGECLRHLAT